VSPVKYKLGLYIPEDDILHSHRREILNTCYYMFKLDTSLMIDEFESIGGKIFMRYFKIICRHSPGATKENY
jgi:hypothetical protein